MSSKTFRFNFQGTVGNAQHVTYQEVDGTLYDVQVTEVKNLLPDGYACYYQASKISEHAFKLEVHICGWVGKSYNTTVYVAAYYEGAAARVREEKAAVHGPIETREFVFALKAKDDNELITQELADAGGKIIDCAVARIEGHPGARFIVEKLGERGVKCSGGFVHEAKDTGKLEARVTAVAALETS